MTAFITCKQVVKAYRVSGHEIVAIRGIDFEMDKGEMVGVILNTPGVHGIAVVSKSGKGFTSNGQDSTSTMFDLKTLKQQYNWGTR